MTKAVFMDEKRIRVEIGWSLLEQSLQNHLKMIIRGTYKNSFVSMYVPDQPGSAIYGKQNRHRRKLLHFLQQFSDDFLKLSGKELLQHVGTISAKIAKEKADAEYDKFEARTRNELSPVELHFIENFERERLKLTSGSSAPDNQ